MSITLDELVTNLEKRPLPAMAITVKLVQQQLDDPNTNNHDLQQVIGLDPGFTMDVYRRFGIISGNKRGPASHIAHAISMLGPAPVQEAIKSLPILNKNLPEAAKSGIYHCYTHAIHASIYAQDIGEQRGEKNPEAMGHAALLYNCAEMALWTYAGKAMQKIQNMVRKGADYGSASHSILGFTLKQLGTELARVWHLPPLIIQSMDHTWQSHPRSIGVVFANSLAQASAHSWYSPDVTDLIESLADFKHETIERTTAHLHSRAASIARQLAGMPLPVTAHSILQHAPKTAPPTPEPIQKKAKKKPTKSATNSVGEKPAKKPAIKPTTQPIQRPATEPSAEPVRSATTPPPATTVAKPQKKTEIKPNQEPAVAPTKQPRKEPATTPAIPPTPTPKPVTKSREPTREPIRAKVPTEWDDPLAKFMRNLRDELNLKHVMFIMLSADKKQAGVGHLIGADTHSALHKFSVEMEGENLFAMLLSRQQGFWLRPENSAKFLPKVPPEVVKAIDTNGFFCMSIFVRNQPTGFVYADGNGAMNEGCYTQFKQLCASLSTELRKSRF
ncbi:MAG: HDOD domain-containing protein [Gammaproteobacteria bacterium]|nr:HDOD domain-containing protein [Gammaproteobacteria bacterium]